MHYEGNYYSYVKFYCDDLIVLHKEPVHVFNLIQGEGFTIKETSALEYFLGGYFEHVKDPKSNNEILMWVSKTYVKHMMNNFNNNFVFETSKQNDDMPTNDKTELDITDL